MSKSLGKTDLFSLFTVPNTLQLSMDIPRFMIYVAFQDCHFLGEVRLFKLFLCGSPSSRSLCITGFRQIISIWLSTDLLGILRSQNSQDSCHAMVGDKVILQTVQNRFLLSEKNGEGAIFSESRGAAVQYYGSPVKIAFRQVQLRYRNGNILTFFSSSKSICNKIRS